MNRTLGSLADRLLSLVAPKTEAKAACPGDICSPVYCYCQGPKLYEKSCCTTNNCTRYSCGTCRFVGYAC